VPALLAVSADLLRAQLDIALHLGVHAPIPLERAPREALRLAEDASHPAVHKHQVRYIPV